jgi:superfamily II helicase
MKRVSKWKREQLIIFDKEQTIFNSNSELMQNDYQFAEKIIKLEMNKIVLCPFCLGKDKLYKFLIKKQDRIDNYKAICPFCKTSLLVNTLLTVIKMQISEFAEWVYKYNFGQNSFFRKIKFEEWSKRLSELRVANEFWLEYHKLKGEIEE